MSTYTQILYQIVFSTKYRRPTLTKAIRPDLFAYIYGLLCQKGCRPYQIGGVDDHLHIVTHLHPSIALADLVKDIKLATGKWLRADPRSPDFTAWQGGYGAFTYANEALPNLVRYVRRQEIHHQKQSSKAELITLLEQQEIEYDPRYLE